MAARPPRGQTPDINQIRFKIAPRANGMINVMTAVAVMQPYFFPYAGYFRLLALADVFVIFDCVQFPRRGWVHRNRLPDRSGNPAWLTLPLQKAHRDARIRDIRMSEDAEDELRRRCRKFPVLLANAHDPLVGGLLRPETLLVDYLEKMLRAACGRLSLETKILRSSAFDIDPGLRGQDRVIAIAKRLDATTYLNAPGGRDLYDPGAFAREGIDVVFMRPHHGPNWSLLYRLLSEPAERLRAEIGQHRSNIGATFC